MINNCGGSASAEQTTQRSEVIEIERSAVIGLNADSLLYAQIESAYKSVRGVVKSHTVSAAPKTNMRFVLLWTEQVDSGVIIIENDNTKVGYKVKVPISVQQSSAEELPCQNITSSQDEDTYLPDVREFEFQVKGQTATWGPLETGIYIREGDQVEISYISGSWWIGKTESSRWVSHFPVSAEGYKEEDVVSVLGNNNPNMCRPMISAPFGALIGSVGRYKQFFNVGRNISFISENSDILYLRINYQDHNQVQLCPYGGGGTIIVKVRVASP